jgi:hypothetical protein
MHLEPYSHCPPCDGRAPGRAPGSRAMIVRSEVRAEIEAQLRWYRDSTGLDVPPHVDGHQHCHVHPAVRDIVAETLVEFGVRRVRVPGEQDVAEEDMDEMVEVCEVEEAEEAAVRWGGASGATGGKGANAGAKSKGNNQMPLCSRCSIVSVDAAAARRVFARAGLASSRCFVGLGFCGGHYTVGQMVDAIQGQLGILSGYAARGAADWAAGVEGGVERGAERVGRGEGEGGAGCAVVWGRGGALSADVEVMVHPGYLPRGSGEDAWDDFDMSPDRVIELETLCSVEMGAALRSRYTLVS